MTDLHRLRAALDVARCVADPGHRLGRRARSELARCSGLSPEGIELALGRHLETDAGDADLARLCDRSSRAPRCQVVLAANVCTAPLRAIACALAVAPQVLVRPSRRDPVLATILAEELDGVELCEAVDPRAGDEVHLYGSDEALAELARDLPGVTLRTHGSGVGVALVDGPEDAPAVAADLVPFDGRGCLSPRLVLAPDPTAFAQALHHRLAEWAARVPRGPLGQDARCELTRYGRTLMAAGEVLVHEHHLVAIDPAPRALLLPPAHRATLVVPRDTPLGEVARYVTCVGTNADVPASLRAASPRARHAPLGAMQRPPLDGPVDLRSAR